MNNMTPEEYRHFMLDRPRTGKLATVRKDGRPHIAPVWFIMDGDDLLFTTWHRTVKAANLKRDSRVSLCVDDEAPPFSFVVVEGTAEITTALDAEEFLSWATKIARRYMGDELAESYGERNAVEGEWLIRIRPTKIIAKKGISE